MKRDACLLLPIAVAAQVWFVGNLGLFLSAVCKSSNRAFSALLVLVLLIIAGTWTIGYLAEQQSRAYAMRYILRGEYHVGRQGIASLFEAEKLPDMLNPVVVWWKLTDYQGISDDRWRQEEISTAAPAVGAICYFLAGCCFYFLSWLRFRHESQRL